MSELLQSKQGFSNPTKTDRRFFQSRIREMIQQGLIEKVVVPNARKKSLNTSVKCFRLVKHEVSAPPESAVVVSDMEDDIDDVLLGNAIMHHGFAEYILNNHSYLASNGIKLNITIHKQIIDLLEDSGTSGMTLNVNTCALYLYILRLTHSFQEISASLGNFDKRTIELLLARADKFHPPPHLSDLRIASLMETSGRERRHRYFTVSNYRKLIAEEQLDNVPATGTESVDLENVGGFFHVSDEQFYDAERDLIAYGNTFKDTDGQVPKGKKTVKNPILPDGTVKRGRPRKTEPKDVDDNLSSGIKRSQIGKRKKKELPSPVVTESSTPIASADRGEGTYSKKARLEPTQSELTEGTVCICLIL